MHYYPNSYKTLDASGKDIGIDWSKYKNPMVPEPKKPKNFVMIDYLRFDNKSEVLQM